MPSKKETKWTSGINPKSSMSYEKYMKSGLEMISKYLSTRVYKLAPKDEYPSFERGKDLRVGLFWKGKPLMDATLGPDRARKYEIIVELSFWYQSNKNKEDREYMRQWADMHLKTVWEAHEKARLEHLSKMKTKKVKKQPKKRKAKVGSTQDIFEQEKKK